MHLFHFFVECRWVFFLAWCTAIDVHQQIFSLGFWPSRVLIYTRARACICLQVSRSVGHRMGKHLDAIVPLFLKFLGEPADEALQNDATSELRETCLQVNFQILDRDSSDVFLVIFSSLEYRRHVNLFTYKLDLSNSRLSLCVRHYSSSLYILGL